MTGVTLKQSQHQAKRREVAVLLRARGWTLARIGKQFRVSKQIVCEILKGR